MKRFDVYLIDLNPTTGSELYKTRPCVIVSPNSLNYSNMIIVVPMTSTRRKGPWRIPIVFDRTEGDIVLDQIRSVDTKRLIKHWGALQKDEGTQILSALRAVFSERTAHHPRPRRLLQADDKKA
jgi:mRNA interferase MazF